MNHWLLSSWKPYLKAAGEVAFITGFGLMAFLVVPVFRWMQRSVSAAPLEALTWYDTIARGQLFPFCFSMIGAVLWLLSQEFKGKGIPARPFLNIVIWGLSIFCVLFYSLTYTFERELPPNIVAGSVAMVLIFIVIRFFLVVVREAPIKDVQKQLQDESKAMTDRARERRKPA